MMNNVPVVWSFMCWDSCLYWQVRN